MELGVNLGYFGMGVDGDNVAAVRLYEGLGFTLLRTEAQYRGIPTLG